MFHPRRNGLLSVLFYAAMLGGSAVRGHAADSQPLPPSAAEAFAWFEMLGFPDVKDCPFVHVATGGWHSGSGPAEKSYLDGFLVRQEKDGSFTILTLNLFSKDYKTTPPETPPLESIGFERRDFKAAAVAYLQAVENAKPDKLDEEAKASNYEEPFYNLLSSWARTFAWAWACHRQGLHEQAALFYDQAIRLAKDDYAISGDDRDFIHALERSISGVTIWEATDLLGKPSVNRREILARFESILRLYPASGQIEQTRHTTDILRTMVAEDDARASKPPPPMEQLSVAEQIQELIFQLRNQQDSPNWNDLEDESSDKGLPSNRLYQLGYAAVPALIESLENERFTRHIDYTSNFGGGHYVGNVGFFSLTILDHIAGRYFSVPDGYQQSVEHPDSWRKAAVLPWWEEARKKGEKQTYIDSIVIGAEEAPVAAKRLLTRYLDFPPSEVFQLIRQGIAASENPNTRANLTHIAAQLPVDEAIPLLLEKLEHGVTLLDRVSAAWGLQSQKSSEAVRAMLREWNTLPLQKDFSEIPFGPPEGAESIRHLVGFLAQCNVPEAVLALGRELSKRRLGLRRIVVDALDSLPVQADANASGGASSWGYPSSHSANSPASILTLTAVEQVLITSLDDSEIIKGFDGFIGDASFHDPRICDMAGQALHDVFKDKYPFDICAPIAERDRQIIAGREIWRKSQAATPSPSPAP